MCEFISITPFHSLCYRLFSFPSLSWSINRCTEGDTNLQIRQTQTKMQTNKHTQGTQRLDNKCVSDISSWCIAVYGIHGELERAERHSESEAFIGSSIKRRAQTNRSPESWSYRIWRTAALGRVGNSLYIYFIFLLFSFLSHVIQDATGVISIHLTCDFKMK